MRLQLKIIELLAKQPKLTMNQIAKELNESYSFVNRIINRMITEDLIKKEVIGHSLLCSLNRKNDKTKALIILNEVERKQQFLEKNKELKLITDEILTDIKADSIAIFGSYAKNTQTKDSDIDILILSKNKIDTTKLTREIHAKYGKEISPVIMAKIDPESSLVKEIIKNHVILAGFEKFMDLYEA
jgi:predicted nucleotidyltransferase